MMMMNEIYFKSSVKVLDMQIITYRPTQIRHNDKANTTIDTVALYCILNVILRVFIYKIVHRHTTFSDR